MRWALALSLVLLVACAPRQEMRAPNDPAFSTHADANGSASEPAGVRSSIPSESAVSEVGEASWYGGHFAGKKTSNGERYDPRLFTAAHRRLPFGTWVEVRRIDTGRTVRVRINDRGPNGRAAHRVIDLSQRAAEEIDLVRQGVVRVELRIVSGP